MSVVRKKTTGLLELFSELKRRGAYQQKLRPLGNFANPFRMKEWIGWIGFPGFSFRKREAVRFESRTTVFGHTFTPLFTAFVKDYKIAVVGNGLAFVGICTVSDSN